MLAGLGIKARAVLPARRIVELLLPDQQVGLEVAHGQRLGAPVVAAGLVAAVLVGLRGAVKKEGQC